MAESKREETFKVIDRRHFNEKGDLRQEVVEQDRREEEAAAKKSAAQPAAATKTLPKEPTFQAGTPQVGPREVAPTAIATEPANEIVEPAEAIESSRSFQMLVDFLTRNAAAMLGGMADPRTGEAFVDLEGAREVIDMLDVLREKTRGNLAKADDDLLIEVLGSLKLSFMEISKVAAEAMAKKAKVKS